MWLTAHTGQARLPFVAHRALLESDRISISVPINMIAFPAGFVNDFLAFYGDFSESFPGMKKSHRQKPMGKFHGDPYGNRTHVTAVKGRCLNRLTNGPGSGNLIRTDDIPGMNRLLYQLSYAAMWSMQFRHRRNSFCIISDTPCFVKPYFEFF